MLLTIGILFCDKDLIYLENLLKNIKDKILINDYEIILLDNRNNFESDISFLNDYKVLNLNNGNIYQLAGRKKIIENANGKYIWFVDADDDIFLIDESFIEIINQENDINVFSYLQITNEKEFWCEENDLFFEGDLLQPDCYKLSCLWNKWLKTEKLKEISKLVPDEIRASASEDNFYNLMMLKNSNTLSYHKNFIYTFNSERSNSAIIDYSNNIEKFKKCFFGLEETNNLIKKYITNEDLEKLHLNLERADCYFYLKKIFETTNAEAQKEMFEIIKTYFSDDVLKETYNDLIEKLNFTEKSFNQIYDLFYSYYGDSFGYIEVETIYSFESGEETRKEKIIKKPLFYS
jgi:hypothetical protein